MTQKAVMSPVIISAQEGKVIISFCLNSELDVSVYTIQLVMETFSLTVIQGIRSQKCHPYTETSREVYGLPC
jgi:hypothetical protein